MRSKLIALFSVFLVISAFGVYTRLSERVDGGNVPDVKSSLRALPQNESSISSGTKEAKDRIIVVQPKRQTRESLLLPARAMATSLEELEKSINEPEEDEDLVDSDDLPPVVRDMAGQLMDLRDEIDSTTLDTVNDALDLLFFLNMDADKAELRPSGGGVQLKIRIPTEKDIEDDQEQDKVEENEQAEEQEIQKQQEIEDEPEKSE